MKELELEQTRLKKSNETPAIALVTEGDDANEADDKKVSWFLYFIKKTILPYST